MRQRRFVFNLEELLAYLKELEAYGLIKIENLPYLKAQLAADESKA